MNISNFKENLDYLSFCGISLSPEESALVENSLIILQSQNKFIETFLWGRIGGVINDYYIAFGYQKNCLTGSKFFCSINGFEWILLPETQPGNDRLSLSNQNLFQGDLGFVEDVVTVSNSDSSDPCFSKETRKLKEEDRLASTIQMISSECAVIPRGALTMRPDGLTRFSTFFNGLNPLEASDMKNYHLFRKPLATCNENLLNQPDYNYSTDTFDAIDSIPPVGQSFAVNIDNDCGLAVVKSLYWPGGGLLTGSNIRRAWLNAINCNVFSVDWGEGAQTLNYVTARNRVDAVGAVVAQFIDWLNAQRGLPFSAITVAGHSLGAHIAGAAGKRTSRGRIQAIVGLDPAGPLFSINNPSARIHHTDANHVECHYTDAGGLGYDEPLGHANFYPNWGSSMPGCITGLCSHNIVEDFYEESIGSNRFVAQRCGSFAAITWRTCVTSGLSRRMGGEPLMDGTSPSGSVFFLRTNSRSPFAQG